MTEAEREKVRSWLARLPDDKCQSGYDAFAEQLPDFCESLDSLPLVYGDMIEAIEAREENLIKGIRPLLKRRQITLQVYRQFLAAHRVAICWAYRLYERKSAN